MRQITDSQPSVRELYCRMNDEEKDSSRRSFLGQAAIGAALGVTKPGEAAAQNASGDERAALDGDTAKVTFPRSFTGEHLKMIAFPLGGVGAGSVSLGGRGQLRDWEIFNKADKGNELSYAFPCIWAQAADQKPVAHVLEARYLPPYEGQEGLGVRNAPGLSRLAQARFTGQYPLARIDFEDDSLPVQVALEAFTPIIPHEPDDSGLPLAVLRYRVKNPGKQDARVAIAWSVDNPVAAPAKARGAANAVDLRQRSNEFRTGTAISGLVMTNAGLAETDVYHGSFVLGVLNQGDGKVTYLRGWPSGRWWNSPLLFWDDFSRDGELGPEPERTNAVGAVCLKREIAPGGSATYEFLLAWHFPNRTPAHCGWSAPQGDEHTVIGNWYTTRFADAWTVAEYAAQRLPGLEARTRLFAKSLQESTLPAAVLEAACANLSTLATTTCFRTADGEFHGFEGVDDKLGCCFGNCTHVWNYETTTAHLFPSFARSLRKAAFGFSMDDAGAMHFRQLLPDGKERSGFAAADGQMGQIVHAYLDWVLSGNREWLQGIWPRVKKAIEFAWIPGGWDANQDGVMEGVQHNTYDVEFFGPNPQCGVYYLAALRAGEEMARAADEPQFADRCRELFERGKQWFDTNSFNGEYYVQQIRPYKKEQIAASLRSDMGAEDTEHPEYQIGKGCLVDQLIGQYLAEVCGLGPLLNESNVRKTLESIYKYNHKRTLYAHDSVQRTFALNNESALVICDYAKAPRPTIPFPYFAEVMTGFEYSVATHMMYAGMVDKGVECVTNIRSRYDGRRRNPWDEAECGHHYARAMAAWSGILALSGFRCHAERGELSILPAVKKPRFTCFWSTAMAWGVFTQSVGPTLLSTEVTVHSGRLDVKSCVVPTRAGTGTSYSFGKNCRA